MEEDIVKVEGETLVMGYLDYVSFSNDTLQIMDNFDILYTGENNGETK